MIAVAVVFAGSMLYGLGYSGYKSIRGAGPASEEGLATVNGRDVDQFRYNQILRRLTAASAEAMDPATLLTYQSIALSQLIEFTLTQQEASKHFGATGEELNKAMSDIMKSNKIPDEREFDRILKSQGFSVGDLRRMISDEIAVQKMFAKMNQDTVIGPDDLREVRASHILIGVSPEATRSQDDSSKKKAEEVLALVQKGGDFAMLAKKYSDDRQTAVKGGDLGYFNKNAMVDEFANAAFALKPGQISPVVKTRFGYHIIKVTDTRLRSGIDKDKLLQEKRKLVYMKMLYDLRSKAKIEIKNHLLSAVDKMVKGDLNGARDEFKASISAHPESPYPHLFYGQMLFRMNEPLAASDEFIKASDVAGADPYLHIYVGKALLDIADQAKGSTKEAFSVNAKQEFMKASVLAGDNLKAHEDLEKAFKKIGMKSLAAEENTKIAQLKEKQKFEDSIKKLASGEAK